MTTEEKLYLIELKNALHGKSNTELFQYGLIARKLYYQNSVTPYFDALKHKFNPEDLYINDWLGAFIKRGDLLTIQSEAMKFIIGLAKDFAFRYKTGNSPDARVELLEYMAKRFSGIICKEGIIQIADVLLEELKKADKIMAVYRIDYKHSAQSILNRIQPELKTAKRTASGALVSQNLIRDIQKYKGR